MGQTAGTRLQQTKLPLLLLLAGDKVHGGCWQARAASQGMQGLNDSIMHPLRRWKGAAEATAVHWRMGQLRFPRAQLRRSPSQAGGRMCLESNVVYAEMHCFALWRSGPACVTPWM